jgi:hypothetical protein
MRRLITDFENDRNINTVVILRNEVIIIYVGKHVSPIRHIILFPSQLFLALTSLRILLSVKATNINFILSFI